jgi:hypothetical protein
VPVCCCKNVAFSGNPAAVFDSNIITARRNPACHFPTWPSVAIVASSTSYLPDMNPKNCTAKVVQSYTPFLVKIKPHHVATKHIKINTSTALACVPKAKRTD